MSQLFGEAGFVHGVFLWLAGGGIAAGLARKLPVMEAGVSKSKCSLPHGGGGDVRSPPHRSPSPPSLPVRFGSTRCSLRLAPPLVQLVAPRVGAFTLASDNKRIHIARVLKACLALEYDAGSRWLVNQLLSSWETPVEALGPTARFSVWVPAEAICLGRKTPHRCMLHAATACSNARQHFQR